MSWVLLNHRLMLAAVQPITSHRPWSVKPSFSFSTARPRSSEKTGSRSCCFGTVIGKRTINSSIWFTITACDEFDRQALPCFHRRSKPVDMQQEQIIYAKQRGENVTGYCCLLNTTLYKHEHQATSFPAALAHAKGHEQTAILRVWKLNQWPPEKWLVYEWPTDSQWKHQSAHRARFPHHRGAVQLWVLPVAWAGNIVGTKQHYDNELFRLLK